MTYSIQFKYVNINDEFDFDNRTYIKTNHQRGYYWQDNKKVFKTFKKSVYVLTNHQAFAEGGSNG